MIRVTFDETLRSRLPNLSEPVELCDESTKVVGRVWPGPDPLEYDRTEPPISEEALQRREQSADWYTTGQVLEHLRNLEKS